MNKLLFLIMISSVFTLNGQVTDTIKVGYTKSAYLVFKSNEVKYDCGSEDVLVRISENKIILQAGVEGFEETNLFVQDKNDMYMFIIVYDDNCKKYLYDYAKSKTVVNQKTEETTSNGSPVLMTNTDDQDSIMKVYAQICDNMLRSEDKIANRGVVKYKMGIYLRDIAIYDDKMFLEFEVKNNANIPYVVDYYQYRVKSVKKRIKGESFQEILLKPILEYKRPERFEGKQTVKYVIVMDKFVLTENKKLVIEHWEDNGDDLNIEGGRKIDFDVFSKDVLNVNKI